MKHTKMIIKIITIILIFSYVIFIALGAEPMGPTITYIYNSTGSSSLTPTTVNNQSYKGGTIITLNLNGIQQDTHYKAYVGNVTGELRLQDADNFSVYKWSLTTTQGEIFATRANSVTWPGIECAGLNKVDTEMVEMNHTPSYTLNDNLSSTFDDYANNHSEFWIGSKNISSNSCNFTTRLFSNNAASPYFQQILLWESNAAKIIYTTLIDNDRTGYRNGQTYDYQLLVPEKGEPAFTGATTYYFYVELA